MKKLTLIALVALMVVIALQSCEKQNMANITVVDGKIKATKTELSRYALDTLLFTGANSTDSVKWTVTPSGSTSIEAKGNAAVMYFIQVGTYTVSAQKLSGGPVETITIKVTPPVPPPFVSEKGTTKSNVVTASTDTVDLIPITGDVEIGFTFYRIPAGDSVNLNMNIRPVDTFCSRGTIQYASVLDAAQNFSLNVLNVRAPKNCAGATLPDSRLWIGDVFKQKLIGIGTHQLTITHNGVTYTGTIVVAATNVTINWAYTSGVIMLTNIINM